MSESVTRKPTHPGVLFLEDVLKPRGVKPANFAKSYCIDVAELMDTLEGKIPLSVEIAAVFSTYTNTAIESWLRMQTDLNVWLLNEANQETPVESLEQLPKFDELKDRYKSSVGNLLQELAESVINSDATVSSLTTSKTSMSLTIKSGEGEWELSIGYNVLPEAWKQRIDEDLG